jgi:hypothetical protein
MIAAPRPQRVDEKERIEAFLSHGIPGVELSRFAIRNRGPLLKRSHLRGPFSHSDVIYQ